MNVSLTDTTKKRETDAVVFHSYRRNPEEKAPGQFFINLIVNALLRLMAANFNLRPKLRKWLKGTDGWINFTVGIRSRDNSVKQSIYFHEGRVRALWGIRRKTDTALVFRTPRMILKMLTVTPDEMMIMLVESRMNTEGNLAYMNLFNFFLNLLMGKSQERYVAKKIKLNETERKKQAPVSEACHRTERSRRRNTRISGKRVDPGVKHLADPYLPEYGLEDFPRLEKLHDIAFRTTPKICHERPKLLTDWHREHGFEYDREGKEWVPELRQAGAFKYLMENRKPVIWPEDLIAGTHGTSRITPVCYPDASGLTIWGELFSCRTREILPYEIDDESIEILHHDVFPYWAKRNFREWVREEYHEPLCMKIDEHMAAYFIWKTIGMSETVPDYGRIFDLGTRGIVREIENELARDSGADEKKKHTLRAMIMSLEGMNAYARNLSRRALDDAGREKDPVRKAELLEMAGVLERVPENPPETIREAVQVSWLTKVVLQMENSNDGLGFGRLDQLYQPIFEKEIAALSTDEERESYIRKVIELIGCLFLKATDHLTLNPDIANHIFGGSPPGQTITIGGVTPEGEDAVNDMTYIILKVTELLGLNDPNVNARFHAEKNSDEYLRRCNDVNYITGATPSLHNDIAMIESLSQHGYAIEDIRDWSATGCVEPTMVGRHCGATSAINISIVAALEMALNNGYHPLMGWELGPETGSMGDERFATFDEFMKAFEEQYGFLIDNSVDYNNLLGLMYQKYRPSNLMSVFTRGCMEKGRTVVNGGAQYNSTGATCIGLADVTDSLMVIKKLVFDERKLSLWDLKKAIDGNFSMDAALHALVTTKVPFFGSGSDEAVDMANRIIRFTHDRYTARTNYRGGSHHTGFWSMSGHAAYGRLTGALPSGRLAGRSFTPGLTPEPNASRSLLDNIRDVAKLDPKCLDDNIAFNVKVVPSAKDSHEEAVNQIFSYSRAFFTLGGMQMQLNVMPTDMMRDAMANPEHYRHLLVRISGYCAYFVQLDRDAQLELIERAEYGI